MINYKQFSVDNGAKDYKDKFGFSVHGYYLFWIIPLYVRVAAWGDYRPKLKNLWGWL